MGILRSVGKKKRSGVVVVGSEVIRSSLVSLLSRSSVSLYAKVNQLLDMASLRRLLFR